MGGFAIHHSVGVAGGGSALHADGSELDHLVGHGQKLGHGSEGLAAKVLIQPGADDVHAPVGHLHAEIHDLGVEELHLLDQQHLGVFLDLGAKLIDVFGGIGFVLHAHVRDDHGLVVSVVDAGFEYLNPLFGVEAAASQTNQFFAFAGVHAAAHDGEFAEGFQSWSSEVPSISASNISSISSLTSSSVALPSSRTRSRISDPDSGSSMNSN